MLEALNAAERIVREQQGFVLESRFLDDSRRATGHMAFKVPSEQLAATLVALARLGQVTARNIRGQDLTQAVAGAEHTRNQAAAREEGLRSRATTARSGEARSALGEAVQASDKATTAAEQELYSQRVQTVLATVSATFESKSPRFSPWAATTRTFTRASGWSARLAGVVSAWVVGLAPAWVPAGLLVWLGRRVVARRRRAAAPSS